MRHASVEAEAKLGQMGKMLSGFLEDELSEAYLGLHSGARAHMERFRTLIHGFYANKFGYFPPPSIHPRTTIFEVDIFRTLRNDFEALYDYLVDETFDISRGSLPSAQGGLCALQSVQSFDARCKFTTLNHPIPLLPNIRPQAFSKRLTWFGKQSKLSASQRTATYIALVKATNENNIELLDNDLVRAYRKFEEESIYSPIKGDKQEQLGHIDARKVRWILVYAVYQALRQVTQPPVEVKDFVGAPYNLCIPTINLPPWKEAKSMPPCTKIHTTAIPRNPSASATGWGVSTGVQTQPDTPTFDIKPDIDYLGLLNKEAASSVPSRQAVLPGAETPAIRRTGLTRSLSRNGTFRRSLRLFGHQEIEKCAPAHHRKSQQYHEIVVLGYGNGTQDVEFTPLDDESGIALMISETKNPATASRSPSTASQSSRSADDSSSEDGSASTVDTSLTESVGNSPVVQTSPNPWTLNRNKSFCGRGPPLEERDYTPRAMSLRSSSMPPAVLFCPEKSEEQPGKGVKQRRSQTLLDRYRKSLEPEPLEIRKTASLKFGKRQRVSSRIDQASSEELWDDIRSFTEMRTMSLKSVDVGLDSYNDLGGFTELHDVLPRRLSTIF